MTTTRTTTSEAQAAAQAPQDAPDAPDATEDTTAPESTEAERESADDDAAEDTEAEAGKGDRTEARLRKRAQAAEAERDSLAARLESLQRAEVERLATGSGRLADGADVWHGVGDLADVLDDDGNVSPTAVEAATAELIRAKPHYAARRFEGTADGGPRTPTDPAREDPWKRAGDVIRRTVD